MKTLAKPVAHEPMNLLEWPNATDRQVKQFALLLIVLGPVVAYVWSRSVTIAGWTCVGCVLPALIGYVWPRGLAPIYSGLMWVTRPIGAVVSELILLLVYFAIFWPIGACLRWSGRDSLQPRPDRSSRTYWHTCDWTESIERYFRRY